MGKIERMRKLNKNYARLPFSIKGGKWGLSKKFVKGEGNLNADIMLIGQAPGANEDIYGRPFVGISGRLLDSLLASIGISRSEIYITSTIQFFPPKNRAPTNKEIELCREYLMSQIEIISPKLIILVGSIALKSITDMSPIMEYHGTLMQSDGIFYYPTLHPAAAIRIKRNMPIIQRDFESLGVLKDNIL